MYFLPIIGLIVAGAAATAAIMQWKRSQNASLASLGLAPSAASKSGPGMVFDTRVQEGGKAHHIVDLGRFGRGLEMSRRTHAGETKPHWGLDITAPFLAPVRAALNGTVIESGQHRGYGEAIAITHPQIGQSTFYAHLSRRLVNVGDQVVGGQLIGLVGNSCEVSGEPTPCWCRTQPVSARCPTPPGTQNMGSHLHFEVHPTPQPNFSPTFRRLDPVEWLNDRSRQIAMVAWEVPVSILRSRSVVEFGDA
jgi:murein DD-endopeptidase MepM/ murein hydrolase activator NlpD